MAVEPSILSRLLTWNKKSTPETVDAEQYAEAFDKFKGLLLEQYQLRLQTKTAKRLPINLSAKSTDFGMDPDRARAFLPTQTIESQDIAKEIDKILHTHDRLLIIGDPGAGKTTILLFAAINILMDKSREQKLPLIINLATWQAGRDFKEWYAQSVAHTYSLSLVFAEELLRRNVVVPFFDGFDEVAEDAREDCLQKMSAYFGDQRSRQLIVSSRKKEYAATKADAPVYAEIEVQPLSLSQIKKALSENAQTQAADRALLDAIERDAHLAKAVETPFYLNTASFLFGKGQRTWGDFPFRAESAEGRQGELVEIFVGEQVPDLKDRKHLGFLARKMEEERFLVFELVKMQPRWSLGEWINKLWYQGASGLFLGLLLGGLLYFINPNMVLGDLILALVLGAGLGLIVVIIMRILISNVYTQDIQGWHWEAFIRNINKRRKKGWYILFAFSFILGLLCSLGFVAFGFSYSFDGKFGVPFTYETLSLDYAVSGFIFGSIYCLTFILIDFGKTKNFLLAVPSPYKRFWSAFKHSFIDIPPFILSAAFSILIAVICSKSAFSADLFAWAQKYIHWYTLIAFSLALLLIPIIASQTLNHFFLRLILYIKGNLPLRLVTFLDRMTDQYIFEDNRRTIKGKKQRGATWRFRHKILQDYFAGLNP